MAIAKTSLVEERSQVVPTTMMAAVYRGVDDVRMETVAVPEIGPREMLVRVHTCGICGTDLKKISTGSHSAPRIFGHETSGVVAAVGTAVDRFRVGDRVMVFHHIPCGECYYCRHKTFAQCPAYKKVGCTAGFEPSGAHSCDDACCLVSKNAWRRMRSRGYLFQVSPTDSAGMNTNQDFAGANFGNRHMLQANVIHAVVDGRHHGSWNNQVSLFYESVFGSGHQRILRLLVRCSPDGTFSRNSGCGL